MVGSWPCCPVLARPVLIRAVQMGRDLSRSRAILVSSAVFNDDGIDDLPAATDCGPAMRALLTGDLCGWPDDRVESLPDVAAPHVLARTLVEMVKGVQDVLLLYYAGHGLRTTKGQLALALRETSSDPEALPHTAMPYESLASILRGSPAATKLVILDCCHAELGNKANFQFQSADIDGQPVDGLYFIGASKAWEKAKSPLDGGLPYFTDALIQVVHAGVPGKPPQLTIDQVFTELRARMLRAGRPEPVQSGIRDAQHWPFCLNAAPPQACIDVASRLRQPRRQLAEAEAHSAQGRAETRAITAAAKVTRKTRKRPVAFVAGAVIAAGILGVTASTLVLQQNANNPTPTGTTHTAGSAPAATAACVKQLGKFCHIELRTDDPAPLTLAELFPAAFTASDRTTTYTRIATKLDQACASAVIGQQVINALRSDRCTQVLRASYTSDDGKIIGTIGVVNLATTDEADDAGNKMTGADNFMAPLATPNGIGSKLATGTGSTWLWQHGHWLWQDGHYLVLARAEFTNGKPPSTSAQKQLEHFEVFLIGGTAMSSLNHRMTTGTPATVGG